MSNYFSSLVNSLILLTMLLVVSGCAPSVFPVEWQDAAVTWVYPEPPEKPRIRYLRSVSGLQNFSSKNDSSKRLLRWIGGEDAEQMQMNSPYAVAADGKGRIWMTDPGVGLLYHINLSRQEIDYFSVIAGRQLLAPTGVAYDGVRNRLYISDTGSAEILVFDDEHNYLLSLSPPQGFGRPGGMAVDGDGNLYVADVLRGTAEVFSSGGRYLKSLGSALNPGGKFNHPSNVAVDSQGRVYVVDSFNFRVEILGIAGEPPRSIGGLGDSAGSFARPRGIALDAAGNIYVSDAAFDNIQIFNRQGDLLLAFGQPGKGPGNFCLPAGLTFDAVDRLYVADSCGHRVKIFQFLGN